MLKAFLGAGVGGAVAVLMGWWMRKAWGWDVPEDVQTAFASIVTAIFATLDFICCAVAAWINRRWPGPNPENQTP